MLQPANLRSPLVVDLFAGCGGLSLGFEAQGFETHGFEMDADCCETQELQALGYVIEVKLLNAVDFGTPQNRERLIVVGHQGKFSFPKLLESKISAGEALG